MSEHSSTFDRLGPLNPPREREILPQSMQHTQKRKVARHPLRRTTPLSLAMINEGLRKRKTLRATKTAKTVPRNEEKNSKHIPQNEENSSKARTKKTHQSNAGPSSRPQYVDTSTARPPRRIAGADFQNPLCRLP